jgi:hypothetical protein
MCQICWQDGSLGNNLERVLGIMGNNIVWTSDLEKTGAASKNEPTFFMLRLFSKIKIIKNNF